MTDANFLRRLNKLWKERHTHDKAVATEEDLLILRELVESQDDRNVSDHGLLDGLRDDDHWVHFTSGRHDRVGHRIYFDELVDSGRVTLVTASIQTAADPTKDAGNPLFPPSSEAEDTSAWDRDKSYASVVRREDSDSPTGYRWHMFYTGADTNHANIHTGYASSTDGVNWATPNLGLVAYGGNTANNILRTGYCDHTIYDEYSGLFVSIEEESGPGPDLHIYTQEQPTDPPLLVKTITTGTGAGEGKSIVRRPTDGRWVVYYVSKHATQDRSIYAIVSDTPDLDGTWTEYGIILDAPDQDNQYYSCHPTVFGDQILYTMERFDKTNEQITVDLFVSRNGVDLTSVKAGWIGLGAAAAWDDEMVIATNIVEEDDSWHVYYTGSPANHAATNRDARIGRATVSRGRVGSAGTTGTITTDYMHVGPGAVLTVNSDASGGTLEIEVQDENGDALTGFAQTDFDDITTSAFDHYPTWGQETLYAGTVRLVFHLTTDVTVYSFRLTNTVPASAVAGGSASSLTRAQMSYGGTAQNISHNTLTVVDMDTEEFDSTGSIVDLVNNTLDIAATGQYQVFVQGDWDLNTTGTRTVGIYVNGTPAARDIKHAGAAGRKETTFSALIDLTAGDTVDMRVAQDSGGTRTFGGTNTPIKLGLVRVG